MPGVLRQAFSKTCNENISLGLAFAATVGSGLWKSIALMVAAEYCWSASRDLSHSQKEMGVPCSSWSCTSYFAG